jgi:hypothetical protein
MVAGLAFLLFSNETLGTWGMIVPYLIIYGIGRGTWVSVVLLRASCKCVVFVKSVEIS